ncbi:MAG TPA: AAA family ATPase [Bacilli bacterium]
MARKFGKKNKIKLDVFDYNIGLIGESGIGKTTLAKEVCEKLVGEEGYMILNIGRESGIDAIPGAVYEDVPDWRTFEEIVDDIIENRNTDYKDLKVLVYDTFDELMRITEPEVVRLHNKEYPPEKRVKTINAAFGGFQRGEEKAIELVLDKIWQLKNIGISMFIIGHTKRRTLDDPVTGQQYDLLTTNMLTKYFNAIKTKLHVLGVASVNRAIEREFIQQKTGKNKIINKVVDESRIITFRDDNFRIDSKSRFEEIVPQIPFDPDEFIKAIQDAIKVAYEKQHNKKSFDEEKKEQELSKEEYIKQAVEEAKANRINIYKNEELIEIIKDKFMKASDETKNEIANIMKEYKFKDFKDPEEIPTEALEKIVELLN